MCSSDLDRIQAAPRLALQPGVRLDHTGVNGETTLSPRASAGLLVGRATRISAAAGVYNQSPGYEKLLQSDGFLDLTQGGRLSSERAVHALLAVEHDLSPGITARIEAYRKSYSDLIVGRLETADELDARLAQYDFPVTLRDEIPSQPQITSHPVNAGLGTARGFELVGWKRAVSPDTRLTGWISYAWGLADRKAYGRRFPFDYDRRHALSVVARYGLSRSVEAAATLRVASGFPWTRPARTRVAEAADAHDLDLDGDREELVPARDAQGQLIYTLDFGGIQDLNSARLPGLTRLDARLTYRPLNAQGRWTLYLEVINLLRNRNASSMTCEPFYGAAGPPGIACERDLALPFLPLVGARFRF